MGFNWPRVTGQRFGALQTLSIVQVEYFYIPILLPVLPERIVYT